MSMVTFHKRSDQKMYCKCFLAIFLEKNIGRNPIVDCEQKRKGKRK